MLSNMRVVMTVFAAVVLLSGGTDARSSKTPTGAELLDKILEADPWGLGDAEVTARAVIESEDGRKRELGFAARSRRHDPPLSKSIVRFTAPADLVGTGFLQIQKRDGDDDRYLYLPDLGKSRRIAGKTRSNSFMGTDFSYADLDRRDLREADAKVVGEEKLGKYEVWHVTAKPRGKDAQYTRIEIWVRKDNMVPLKWEMYSRSGTLVKTLVAEEIKRIDGRWFITRSLMTSHQDRRSTRLYLTTVVPKNDVPDDVFTVRTLEKN